MKKALIIIGCLIALILISAVQASLEEKQLRIYYKEFFQKEMDSK